jgi:hypothetical protein
MASSPVVVSVLYPELLDAFDFVSFGGALEHSAYIDPYSGAIHWVSPEMEMEKVPDDLESSDRYIAVPHKNELNLGRDLALSFVVEALPGEYDVVAGLFRKKGAYGRFKDFLAARKLLERWYAFEAQETEMALRAWCRDNNIAVVDALPSA